MARLVSGYGRMAGLVAALALVAVACGDSDSASGNEPGSAGLAAEVASFDVATGAPRRFMVGVFADDERVLAFGTVVFRFGYAGTTDAPIRRPEAGAPVDAAFLLVPGQRVDAGEPGPRLVAPSEARGVYGAGGVTFDRPGIWVVVVTGTAGGRDFELSASFPVSAEPQVVAPGQPAPRTRQPLEGAPGVAPEAIDSRAGAGEPVPDPELHATTIGDALAAGRPVLVVVSTPVFCSSRFCGPITESVEALAARYGARMTFVHLEVWEDFEAGDVNAAAAEWILPRDGGEAHEPWVFVVGADGTVVERFDNVVTDDDLRRAVEMVAAP